MKIKPLAKAFSTEAKTVRRALDDASGVEAEGSEAVIPIWGERIQ